MASFNYTKSAATARRLLAKFGQPVTLSLPDTVTDGPPGVEGTTVPGRSISGSGALIDYDNGEIDGTVIQTGDARLLLEATSEPPENSMDTTINGKAWRVQQWQELAPAGSVVMYTVQLRRV